MRRFAVVVSALAALMLVWTGTALAQEGGSDKVDLCHATHSATNPFVLISVDDDGAYNGHLATSSGGAAGADHQDAEDIIPPFVWSGDGQTYSQNWDAEGQAIFNAGCEVPASGGGPGGNPPPPPPPPTPPSAGGGAGAGGGGSLGGEAAGAGQGALPFTGVPFALLGIAGLALLLGGLGLMRSGRSDN
jgi:hypothetical protein